MSRLVSRAENWERVYTSFQNINFAAFDYDTIKQSILDYIKLYFPESFNDFIESSELIAIIESFAYVAELIAYRLDMNAHENFISTAERQDSILRLAKLVSYTADRPIPNRGLVKITSISTTEGIIDALGNNLANKTITWNDTSNGNWKDQFILVMNRVLSQSFGTVLPADRFQIQDVLFELYNVNTTPLQPGVFKYTASVNGVSVPLELVPIKYDSTLGIVERRPYNNSNFSLVYAQDGLGDASETTGFLCYTKQGSLQRYRQIFDGITPNQFFEIPVDNVNNTDIWINNVDPLTGATLDLPSLIKYKRDTTTGKTGEWVEVDTAHAQNVIFNTNPKRNKYEIETRANNRVRVIFGDGEFADIPSGTFDMWIRTSLNQDIVVSQSAVVNVPMSFSYVDLIGRTQTLSFTFSLINSLQNGSAAETLEHIRTSAPSVYYAQDRMVNGNDYNTFMLQDSSILKLRTINRTFVGDSQYIAWHDPSTTYQNVKLFSDDGAIYYDTKVVTTTTPQTDINNLINTYIQPLLSSTDVFLVISSYGIAVSDYRRLFNTTELARLVDGLTPPPSPSNINMYYNIKLKDWWVVQSSSDPAVVLNTNTSVWPTDFIPTPIINVVQTTTSSYTGEIYDVTRYANRLVFHSPTTKFWSNNSANAVIDFTTLTSKYDTIAILQANTNYNRTTILDSTWNFNVLGQDVYDSGTNIGLPDISRLSILPVDINGDGIPDYLDINDVTYPQGLANIIKPKLTINLTNVSIGSGYIVSSPIPFISNMNDVTVQFADLSFAAKGTYWDEITNVAQYKIVNVGGNKTNNSSVGVGIANNVSNHYKAIIRIDGTNHIVDYTGDTIQTYGNLITKLKNSLITLANVELYAGNIKITSATTGLTSSVEIFTNSPGNLTKFGLTPTDVNNIFQGSSNIFDLINKRLVDLISIITPTITMIANSIVLKPECETYFSSHPSLSRIVYVSINDYVYFFRAVITDNWTLAPATAESVTSYISDLALQQGLWTRRVGRSGLNFGWFHITPNLHLVDPAASNIMDMFIIQKGYFLSLQRWLENQTTVTRPTPLTPLEMRMAYGYMLDNRMLSDTIVLRPGSIKLLFGGQADSALQASFVVIKSSNAQLTDNQIKTTIVATVRNFFDPTTWEFGETFYFSELAAAIHAALPTDINSVVLVPTYTSNHFGDLYQITAREDEIFYPDVSVSNISIVTDYNDTVLRVGTGLSSSVSLI